MLLKKEINYSSSIRLYGGHFMDEIKYRKALGENIRRIRKRQKLTQDVFSEKIGIEPSSLSNIENGKTLPSTLTILQIQQQFNISAQEIFDIEYLNNIKTIEEDIYNSVEKLDTEKKRALWRIIKALEYQPQ